MQHGLISQIFNIYVNTHRFNLCVIFIEIIYFHFFQYLQGGGKLIIFFAIQSDSIYNVYILKHIHINAIFFNKFVTV